MSGTDKRSTVEVGAGVRLSMPSPRPLLQQVFLGLWLVVWMLSGLTMLRAVVTGEGLGRTDGAAVWGLLWPCVAAAVALQWSWAVCGREVLTVAGGTLSLRREVFGHGWTREYPLAAVVALRAEPEPWPERGRHRGLWANEGNIAFDCGGRTVRFGGGLDELEAVAVVNELQAAHAFAG